jgi:NAD(P)H dehydrogenase (quinone)
LTPALGITLPRGPSAWYFDPMSNPDSLPRALVVLCHPNRTGFNQAVAEAAAKSLAATHAVDVVNLYEDGFDPALPADELPRKFSFDETVQRYNALVKAASVYVFAHPDWWGGPPALMKGFIDRVFRPGVAYEFEGYEFLSKKKTALLTGKKAFVFTTTDYPKPEGDDPSAVIWKKNVFAYCGIDDAQVHTFYDTYNSTYEARHRWIADVGAKLRTLV